MKTIAVVALVLGLAPAAWAQSLFQGDGSPNDESSFRGAVSCITENEDAGTTPVANVFTEGFPATPEGDSDIDAHVTLPNPCVAPVIFGNQVVSALEVGTRRRRPKYVLKMWWRAAVRKSSRSSRLIPVTSICW